MMKLKTRSVAACLLIIAGFALSPAVMAESSKAEKDLTQIEHAMCAAMLSNDVAAMAKFSVDDYMEVDGDGMERNKQAALEFTKTVKATVCENSMMKVRVYGDTGIVIGKATFKSDLFNSELKFTDVFVRKGGKWLIVSSHWSEIKPPKQ